MFFLKCGKNFCDQSRFVEKKKANHETLLVQEPVTEVFNPFFNKSYDHLKKGFVIWVTVRAFSVQSSI